MFFVTYVRRELRRRMRQAIFVALGLALGVGLVVTVAAASAGVARAQSGVLSTLYGGATTVTVTGRRQWQQPSRLPKGTSTIAPGPGRGDLHPRGQVHQRGREDAEHDRNPDRGDQRGEGSRGGPAARRGGSGRRDLPEPILGHVAEERRQHSAGGLLPGGGRTGGYPLDGVDTGHPSLGPLGGASLISGHSFTAADAGAARRGGGRRVRGPHSLRIGSHLTIGLTTWPDLSIKASGHRHRDRPPGGRAATRPDVYIPLKAAQELP